MNLQNHPNALVGSSPARLESPEFGFDSVNDAADVDPYIIFCDLCNIAAYLKGKASYGIVWHRKIRAKYPLPSSCEICGRCLQASKEDIQGFQSLNYIERYDCTICVLHFESLPKLLAHARFHTGKTPYRCKLCDAKFTRRDNLVFHEVKLHLRGGLFRNISSYFVV
jgi:hypothetical protein